MTKGNETVFRFAKVIGGEEVGEAREMTLAELKERFGGENAGDAPTLRRQLTRARGELEQLKESQAEERVAFETKAEGFREEIAAIREEKGVVPASEAEKLRRRIEELEAELPERAARIDELERRLSGLGPEGEAEALLTLEDFSGRLLEAYQAVLGVDARSLAVAARIQGLRSELKVYREGLAFLPAAEPPGMEEDCGADEESVPAESLS